MRRCTHQRILQIDTAIPLVVLPSAAIFSTNLAAHLVFFVSTNGQFLQSSFFVHCSPDRFAILRSNLGEDIFELSAAAAVVPALPEQRPVAQLVAAAVLLLLERQVHQHIAVAAVGGLDTSSLVHDSAAAVHIECAASEWKEGQERQRRELRASFAVAVLLEEQEPMKRDASEAAVVLAEFALVMCSNFCVASSLSTRQIISLRFFPKVFSSSALPFQAIIN